MPRLPPASKVTLMDRKSLRDDFEAKKGDLEKQISDLLGEAWTIDIDPKVIVPYHTASTEGTLGVVLNYYMEAAVYQLRRFVNEYGDTGKAEIHAAVPKRVLSMDVDEADKYLYCGPLVKDGVLYIVFRSDRLYVNLDDGLDPIKLTKALSETPAASAATLSPTVKVSIAKNYDPKAEQLRVAVAEAVNVPDLKLVPNFEHNYGAMKAAQAAGVSVRSGWEDALARATADYFAELASQLKRHKIATDDILQEAFVDVVSKREVVLRAVGELKKPGAKCESSFEDGRLYINFMPKTFWVNASEAGSMLVDRLSEVA